MKYKVIKRSLSLFVILSMLLCVSPVYSINNPAQIKAEDMLTCDADAVTDAKTTAFIKSMPPEVASSLCQVYGVAVYFIYKDEDVGASNEFIQKLSQNDEFYETYGFTANDYVGISRRGTGFIGTLDTSYTIFHPDAPIGRSIKLDCSMAFDELENMSGVDRLYFHAKLILGALENEKVLGYYTDFIYNNVSQFSIIPGDANGNEVVTGADVLTLRLHLAGACDRFNVPASDLNGDGSINAADLLALRHKMTH